MLRDALRQGSATLSSQGIEEARLDAELLLRHVLGMNKAALYAGLERQLAPEHLDQFQQLLRRRLGHEPTAYILGHKEFFGIDLYVDRRVLIPRSATELVVERALELAQARWPRSCLIADVGTGCGAIAIALALRLPRPAIYATDVCADALEVAAINCCRHGVARRVKLLKGNLLYPLPRLVHLIVANLPYVKSVEMPTLSAEIRHYEPPLALSAGEDGLHYLRRLIPQARGKLRPGGALVLEIGFDHYSAVHKLARQHFPTASISPVNEQVLSIET